MKLFCTNNVKKLIIITSIIFIVIILSIILLIKNSHNQKEHEIILEHTENNSCNDQDTLNQEDLFYMEQYKNKKLLALTFDDGPSKYTKSFVDELVLKDVPVTFFVVGENLDKYGSILNDELNGNCEVEIHCFTHKLFTKLNDFEIAEQIEKTKEKIQANADVKLNLIRVPYGATSDKVLRVIENNNLKSVLWDVDSLDWKFRNTNKIYNYVLKKIKGNQIILMHDTYKTSIEAALKLIDTLKDKSYTFVSVSKLLEIKEKCKSI